MGNAQTENAAAAPRHGRSASLLPLLRRLLHARRLARLSRLEPFDDARRVARYDREGLQAWDGWERCGRGVPSMAAHRCKRQRWQQQRRQASLASTSLVTTAPAATVEPSPLVTPAGAGGRGPVWRRVWQADPLPQHRTRLIGGGTGRAAPGSTIAPPPIQQSSPAAGTAGQWGGMAVRPAAVQPAAAPACTACIQNQARAHRSQWAWHAAGGGGGGGGRRSRDQRKHSARTRHPRRAAAPCSATRRLWVCPPPHLEPHHAGALRRVHVVPHRVQLYCGPQQYTVPNAHGATVQEAAVEVAVEALWCGTQRGGRQAGRQQAGRQAGRLAGAVGFSRRGRERAGTYSEGKSGSPGRQ